MDARSQNTWDPVGRGGSALILTVVLTSLLAIVGVLFVLLSRIDRMSSAASSNDRQLDLAVRAVMAALGEELVRDTPGVHKDEDGRPLQEYDDRPGPDDPWLASLEPAQSSGDLFWPQISVLQGASPITQVPVGIVGNREPIDAAVPANGLRLSDADGDGVADSNWFVLDGIRSGRGRPIYAAIRVVDHCAMLNVNTAWGFAAADPCLCDGSHQMQIDLVHLAARGQTPDPAGRLHRERAGDRSWEAYLRDAVWRFGDPPAPYSPFDLSDELKLRYRYILNLERVTSRMEGLWTNAYDGGLEVPVTSTGERLQAWARKVLCAASPAASPWMDPDYDYRHISTVASVDRIIDPLGRRMVNVHDVAVPVERLYEALFEGIDPCHPDRQSFAAQLAVNIRDFVDTDSDSTVLTVADANYHGFEPQPFLRQIGFRISPTAAADQTQNEFMVELHNPFDVPVSTRGLVLRMRVALSGGAWEDRIVVDLDSPPQGPDEEEMPETIPARDSLVLRSRRAVLGQDLGSKRVSRAGVVLALYQGTQAPFQLSQSHHVALCRRAGSALLFLDLQRTQPAWFGWDKVGTGLPQFYARAEGRWNILAPRMTLVAGTSPSPLTRYNLPQQQRIRSGPGLASAGFLTLGDLGRVLSIGPHPDPNSATCLIRAMGQASPPADAEICLDLADPSVAGVFQRLTVLSPEQFGADQAETRVKGRININTAPWFVIARLPWMTDEVAQAIVARRDSSGLGRPYRSVADLMQVPEVADLYGADGRNNYDSNSPGPDLTSDTETDDLEERDLLWSRIGNLVTVRSDVFSAYIVVRIGEDGPQRRVLAVLDRSRVRVPQDRVRVLVLQTVPDPR